MDEQQEIQVLAWLKSRVGPYCCTICSHVEFRIDSELGALPVWRPGPDRQIDPSDGIPVVVVSCANCGHVRLFSAMKMGVVPGATPLPGRPEPRPWVGPDHD